VSHVQIIDCLVPNKPGVFDPEGLGSACPLSSERTEAKALHLLLSLPLKGLMIT